MTLPRHVHTPDGRLSAGAGGRQISSTSNGCHANRVPTFPQFAELLAEAERVNVCIVRGEPIPGTDLKCALRRLHDNHEDGEKATLAPCNRAWMMCDWDRAAPPGAPNLTEDPEGAVEAVLALLPPELRDACCWWQLGNSAGVKPGKYSLHLWFLLDRPVSDEDLRGFFLTFGLDPALSNPIQAHYIRKPIFNGMADPCPRRSGIRHGKRETVDATPIILAGVTYRLLLEEEEEERRKSTSAMRPPYSGGGYDEGLIGDLMEKLYSRLITSENHGGWLHCDCPNHTSASHESLHVCVSGPHVGQWKCHGCDEVGGSAFTLAMFLNGGDEEGARRDLKAVKSKRHE